jgi:predicted GTPase
MADLVIVNKVDSAAPSEVERLCRNIRATLPDVSILRAASPVVLDYSATGTGTDTDAVRGRRVVVVDDGPTLTHGGMSYGAGTIAAIAAGAKEIVDPRPFAQGTMAQTLRRYPHLDRTLPAMGYDPKQLADLGATIEAMDADLVVSGTPIDLSRLIRTSKPIVRARYRYVDNAEGDLARWLDDFLNQHGLKGRSE